MEMIDGKSQVVDATAVCDNCGAELVPGRKKCWLCGYHTSGSASLHKKKKPEFASNEVRWQWLISIPIIAVVVIAILIGCWQLDPMLGLVYTGTVLVVLAACFGPKLLSAFREKSGSHEWYAAKIVISVVGGFVCFVLLLISAIGLLVVVCAGVSM
jgi:hypothetical protein